MPTVDKISDYLDEIGDILITRHIIKNSGPLIAIKDQFKRNKNRYVIKGLEFCSVEGQYIRGGEWHNELDIKLDVDVKVSGAFIYENVSEITINIEYTSLDITGTQECKGCWHLDYHVKPGEESLEFMHPHFHLHHGGQRVNALPGYGQLILLDNPRVMHHPLDVFLAIDFVISNFISQKQWNALRADGRYKKIMEEAQMHWWKPYYEQLGNYWIQKQKPKSSIASQGMAISKNLNPHLI